MNLRWNFAYTPKPRATTVRAPAVSNDTCWWIDADRRPGSLHRNLG